MCSRERPLLSRWKFFAQAASSANLRFSPYNIGIANLPVDAVVAGLGRIMPDRPILVGKLTGVQTARRKTQEGWQEGWRLRTTDRGDMIP
jgi:hypothetical protein